jgi:hypothetical protein
LLWLPDAKHLLFACKGDATLYTLQLIHAFPSLDVVLQHTIDLKETQAVDERGQPCTVCGPIHTMALDPHGERLAITFEDDMDVLTTSTARAYGLSLVAVFMLQLNATEPLLPLGFLQGPSQPSSLHFAQHFAQGSLLSIVWSQGKVTFIPFLYTPQ